MSAAERLTLRVLGALLREDVLGLRTRGAPTDRPDGRWLRLAAPPHTLLLPVEPEGFQCEYAARLPLLEVDGAALTGLPEILAALGDCAEEADRSGYAAFAEECRQTLATMELHDSARDRVHAALTARYGAEPADWTGLGASLALDTLAAHLDHPVYPTARGRAGLGDAQLIAYAPEFHPSFELRWLALPAGALTVEGTAALPPWWPTPAELGITGLTGPHLTLPVHPLSVGAPLDEALRAVGLDGRAVLVPRPYLTVVPTLSMRTVAVAADPAHHLKLPLATASLGLRNRRTIKPGTLVDGAAGQRLLEAVLEREPRFAGAVLHADEQCYAHAGHELLAVLLRRYPTGLDEALTVPLAALTATAPGGRLVLDHLADRFHDGDPAAFYDEVLILLLDWQTTLFGYGIALESHQQNVSLVLDRVGGRTRTRLLLKDNDGPRVNTRRLDGALGLRRPDRTGVDRTGVDRRGFHDDRILGDDDRPLTDLFATVTGHLCTAALAFALEAHGRVPLATSLRQLRVRLTEALDRLGPAGEPLRVALLEAERLPVKAMVTAGTLLSKQRSGATDINKHYTTGPNYLRRQVERR